MIERIAYSLYAFLYEVTFKANEYFGSKCLNYESKFWRNRKGD